MPQGYIRFFQIFGKNKRRPGYSSPRKGEAKSWPSRSSVDSPICFFFAALGSECVICHGKCCSCPCHQRLEIIPNDCECPADRNAEDVGRVVRPLCLNLARAVVCHAEQSVIAVSDLSKSFAYIGSSFLTEWPFLML